MSLWIESEAAQVVTAPLTRWKCFFVFLRVRERELVKGGDLVVFYLIYHNTPPGPQRSIWKPLF